MASKLELQELVVQRQQQLEDAWATAKKLEEENGALKENLAKTVKKLEDAEFHLAENVEIRRGKEQTICDLEAKLKEVGDLAKISDSVFQLKNLFYTEQTAKDNEIRSLKADNERLQREVQRIKELEGQVRGEYMRGQLEVYEKLVNGVQLRRPDYKEKNEYEV